MKFKVVKTIQLNTRIEPICDCGNILYSVRDSMITVNEKLLWKHKCLKCGKEYNLDMGYPYSKNDIIFQRTKLNDTN